MKQENRVTRLFSGKKAFSLLLAVLLVLGCSIGATLAYLTATTNEVTNTFTVGKVSITLQEHKYDANKNELKTDTVKDTVNQDGTTTPANSYKLIPGKNMPKDPFVTVEANSEKCWLFVAVEEESNKLSSGIENDVVQYSVKTGTDGWNSFVGTEYNFKDGVSVYYRVVNTATTDQNIYVLEPNGECEIDGHENGCVTVNADVTDEVTDAPSLTFTAAAIQYDGLEPATTGGDAELAAAKAAFDLLPEGFTSGIIKTSGGEAGE